MGKIKITGSREAILPDAEEDAAITRAAESDPDNPIWTDEDFAKSRRLSGNEVADLTRAGRPPLPEAERKQRVTLYLDRDVVGRLKADGKGWQTRANATLRRALGL